MSIEKNEQKEVIDELISTFNPIESEVVRMMGNREIFNEIIGIAKDNANLSVGNSFWDFLKECYASTMVSAICRQIDNDQRSSSLVNFLNRLLQADIAMEVTKEWYVSQYHSENDIIPDFMEGIGNNDFEEHFGQREFIDPKIIRQDLERLTESTREIKKFRNKRIAHRDKNNNIVFDLNFDNLDSAIETIREITSKYYLLLKQGGNDLIPVDQTNWQSIFTHPWIEKENEYEN